MYLYILFDTVNGTHRLYCMEYRQKTYLQQWLLILTILNLSSRQINDGSLYRILLGIVDVYVRSTYNLEIKS